MERIAFSEACKILLWNPAVFQRWLSLFTLCRLSALLRSGTKSMPISFVDSNGALYRHLIDLLALLLKQLHIPII